MASCKYYDVGWCYAPKVIKSNDVKGACIEPEYCPYLKSQMTEKERIEGEIKILQKKLALLEEMEKTKSPVEEAFKRVFSYDPEGCDKSFWIAFQNGYSAAQEDYKVGEYQEPEVKKLQEKEWKNVALEFGKKLPAILPHNYDELSPDAWFRWVVFTYDKYMEQRDKESGYTPTPQTPEQEAVKQGVVSSHNKSKPLTDLIYRWWCDIFTIHSNWDMETSIEDLVDRIQLWLPKEQSANSQNAYVECTVEGFNDCLNKIKGNLR